MPEPPAWRYERIIKPVFDLPTGHWVLKGCVLTCVGDKVIEDGFVEIEGEKIKAVGRAAELGTHNAEAIETDGTILPGLFNCHAHLGWDGVHPLALQSLYDSPEISAYKAASNMLLNLRGGVTTVRDLGMNDVSIVAKRAVEQGIFPGPRLLICGRAIAQTGGHTYWCSREATGADEMRRAVREQVRAGADFIKIFACHDRLEYTDAELEALIDEAHRLGVPITAHALYNDAVNRMLRFGIDCIEHGGSMTDETVQLLLDQHVPIVFGHSGLVLQADPAVARKYEIPEWKIASRQRQVGDPSLFAGLVKAAKAGVLMALGTDAGSPAVPHGLLTPDMKFALKIGLVTDSYAAIRTATSAAAKVTKLDDKLGTLEAGKLADVVVVAGNLLENLDVLNSVQMTFLAGKRMV